MQQTELFPVPNPCIGVCQSNTKGYCMGCLRSRTERQKWKDLMPAEKMRVIEICDIRKVKLAQALKAKKEKEDALLKGGVENIQPQVNPTLKAVESTKIATANKAVKPVLQIQPDNSLDLF